MNRLEWHDVNVDLPELGEEVLVWIDGHRNPSWRNSYALVAYREDIGWFEERHYDRDPLVGVIKWAYIPIPE